MYKFT